MKNIALTIGLAFSLLIGGCVTAPTGGSAINPAVLANLQTVGWTAANYLQTLNNGQTIATVDQVLAATHNAGDVGAVNLVASIVGQVASVVTAMHNAQASQQQTIAAVNTVLAPTTVAQTAANVAQVLPNAGT